MSVRYYVDLLGSESRIHAFKRGIEEVVGAGDRVLEVGTGLGTFAFFAARCGADKVVAVDSAPIVHVAETLAVDNGLADRVEFVRGNLPEVTLDGPFDLIIFEDFPTTLLDQTTFSLLRTLQEKYLAEGGRMIPSAARLCMAPVESGAAHQESFPLGDGGEDRFGLNWSSVRPLLANEPRRVSLNADELRGTASCGPVLPLVPVPSASDLQVEGHWDASEGGVVCGLAMWFELEAFDGGWITNAPGESTGPWGQWYLPLDPPIQVSSGLTLSASVWRESLDDGGPGWIVWECRVGDEVRKGHEFAGRALGLRDLEDC